jgi:tetratricopeptide (TPR) repeat protein
MSIAAKFRPQWRSQPIFVSSTFRDFHAERDYLNTHVFPLLEERLRERRHQLEPIDLRLGVETVDEKSLEKRELLVLKVCLEEVQRSRPFLLVLLGDRYGSVLPQERMETAVREMGFDTDVRHKSVTALEIEFGLLKEHPGQCERSFFFFRNPLPIEKMPPEQAACFSDAYSPDPEVRTGYERLLELKKRISSDPVLAPCVHHYSADWDPVSSTITGLATFGEMVVEHLWAALEEETRGWSHMPQETWEQQERIALQEFVDQRTRIFTGRSVLLDQLCSHAKGGKPAWAVSISGAPGTGKSALMAELHQRLCTDPALLVLFNAAGATFRGSKVRLMLQRFISEMAEELGLKNMPKTDGMTAEELDETFESLLGQVAQRKPVVVLLDALDQFEPTSRAQLLSWLRPRRWPAQAHLISTGAASPAMSALESMPGVSLIALPPLDHGEVREIAHKIWAKYHRQPNPEVLRVLTEKCLAAGTPAAGNPLWLTLTLEQLNLLDADDFARAERDFVHIRDAGERLRALVLEMAARMPAEVPELYGWLLEQMESAYGKELACAFSVCIGISNEGLRESDLLALMGPLQGSSELAIANLRRGFRAHAARRGKAGQLDFVHAQMREAVRNRYLSDPEQERVWHRAIAGHLQSLPVDDPLRVSELMCHLISADDPLSAARLLSEQSDGFLKSGGLAHAVGAVASLLVVGEEKKEVQLLRYVFKLVEHPELTDSELSTIANRFLFELHDAIADDCGLETKRELAQCAQSVLIRLLQCDPANTELQRDLSVSHSLIGTVLESQGDGAGALEAYQASLAIREDLAKRDPANTQFHRDLWVSHAQIGELLVAQGDVSRALAGYEAGLTIIDGLAKSDPANMQWQQDLSKDHLCIGDALILLGDVPSALASYHAAISILEGLAKQDPSNTELQRTHALNNIKIGEVLAEQGDLSGALDAYRVALSITESLVNNDPSNNQWQRDLCVNRSRIADVLLQQGDASTALEFFRAHWEFAAGIAKRDPSNTEYQRDLFVSARKIGKVLDTQGDGLGAMAAYQTSLAIAEGLAKRDPANLAWQRDLSFVHTCIGNVLETQGDGAGALVAYRASLAISEDLARRDPANTQWQHDLSAAQARIGDVLLAKGDDSGALAAHHVGLAILERLVRRHPTNTKWQVEAVMICAKLGTIGNALPLPSRKQFLNRGHQILLSLKRAGILTLQHHNTQELTDLFDQGIRELESEEP